jgi:ABC-type transport system involved in cytochrome c biogenesis permease subunit
MKKHWPWILTALFVFEVLFALRPRVDKDGAFHTGAFGRLPVLLGGRQQPLDSVARNNLLIIRGTATVPLEGNAADGSWGAWEDIADKGGLTERKWYQFSKRPKKLKSIEWLLEVFARPDDADGRYIFRIHHPELLGELELEDKGVDRAGLRYYAFAQLSPHLGHVESEARTISGVDNERRTPYQKAVMDLFRGLQLYIKLKNSVRPQMFVDDTAHIFSPPNAALSGDAEAHQHADGQYSYQEIAPMIPKIREQAMSVPRDDEAQQSAYGSFLGRVRAYEGLKAVWRDEWRTDYTAELRDFEAVLKPGFEAVTKQQSGQEFDRTAFERVVSFGERYVHMANLAHPMMIPPADSTKPVEDWANVGKALMDSIREGSIPSPVMRYAEMMTAYARKDVEGFNKAVTVYSGELKQRLPDSVRKGGEEYAFNQFSAFKRAMMIYLAGLILTLFFWLRMSENLRRAGMQLVVLALVVHTVGLIWRMYLERRPPVTNLYSSAIFVGWGAAVLGVILERIHRNGIGTVTAAGIGYITLIIAHHLSMDGDTMEMMRAVLDTNFWLATHVTIITLGYAATFLAGFLGIVYIVRGLLTPSLNNETARSLAGMVYGIVCFATLFSFVGTVLGGLWADWSWGRFWGWDPKENGALMIVIWNAIILHLKWGGMIRERGLMNCAVIGNIVTAFSWFGVNMLGIGLHSYGFMDAAFRWLAIFSLTQLALVALGTVPLQYWFSVKRGILSPPGYKPAAS